jgi:electron transfer flavoprotein alpha subunit
MAVLVIAEHDQCHLDGGTRRAVAAGRQVDDEIHLLVVGHQCEKSVIQAASLDGVRQVLVADAQIYAQATAENIAALVVGVAKHYSHVVAASSAFTKNFLPRVSALLDVSLVADVINIENENTFCKPIYSGSVVATIQSSDPIKVLTIRPTAFEPVADQGDAASIVSISAAEDLSLAEVVSHHVAESVRPPLSSARIVIGGGRGIGTADNFTLLETLGDKLGAAVGATRAAVDAGFVGNEMQIGQTGKVIAPDLYIAIGISGAIQHTSGIKDAKTIVAINQDAEAPIFKAADYVLVADCMSVLPTLIEKL